MPYQGPDGEMHPSRKKAAPKKIAYPEPPTTYVQGTFDWGDIDGGLLARAVGRITSRGDAVSYAANRSGTQGSITILSGAERPRYTFTSIEDAERWIQALLDL